jgi:hypothetical protein
MAFGEILHEIGQPQYRPFRNALAYGLMYLAKNRAAFGDRSAAEKNDPAYAFLKAFSRKGSTIGEGSIIPTGPTKYSLSTFFKAGACVDSSNQSNVTCSPAPRVADCPRLAVRTPYPNSISRFVMRLPVLPLAPVIKILLSLFMSGFPFSD